MPHRTDEAGQAALYRLLMKSSGIVLEVQFRFSTVLRVTLKPEVRMRVRSRVMFKAKVRVRFAKP